MSEATTALELLVPCDRCGAEPGEWCRTKTGNRAGDLHGPRYWATQDARVLFWIEQEKAVRDTCRRILDSTSPLSVATATMRSADQMIVSLIERTLAEQMEVS